MKAKEERNKELVRLRDDEGYTFSRLADHFGISRVAVFEIYHREKSRILRRFTTKYIETRYPHLA